MLDCRKGIKIEIFEIKQKVDGYLTRTPLIEGLPNF